MGKEARSAATSRGEPAAALIRAWTTVRTHLRDSAGTRLFDQWLKPIELIAESGSDCVRLGLPSAFMTNWVRNHYADRLLQEFRALLPEICSVSIETCSARPLPEMLRPTSANDPVVTIDAPLADAPSLDPRFTFDRFVVDSSNRVAFNAARALAEPGPPRFSPLYLHSGTGQGKSHLLHAIAAATLQTTPAAHIVLMSAERFMFEFVQALRAKDTFSFKSRLRSVDLLMIDDLQFIAGKDSTQEEFFHTINEVMMAGKRLVISADRCPQALDAIDARITSRLSAGLVADIKPADLQLRRTILVRKLADLGGAIVPLPVLDLLATRIATNIRDLEGALNRLVAYASLTGEPIDMAFAVTTLGDTLRGAARRLTIDDIQRVVSLHFDLKPLELVSARRAVAIARPRQIAMYLAKRLTTRSLPEIGRRFGGRDHSTVIHAVRRIEDLRNKDSEIDRAVRTLLHTLEGI